MRADVTIYKAAHHPPAHVGVLVDTWRAVPIIGAGDATHTQETPCSTSTP